MQTKQKHSMLSYWAINHVKMQIICTKALFLHLSCVPANVGINKKLYSQIKKKKIQHIQIKQQQDITSKIRRHKFTSGVNW